jgi:hypothetical protein
MECLSCPVLLRDFGDDESDQEWTAHKVRLQLIFEKTVLQAIFPNSTFSRSQTKYFVVFFEGGRTTTPYMV